jgi:hypothetical protein
VVIGDASTAALADGERWGLSPSVGRRRRGCVEWTDGMERMHRIDVNYESVSA